MLQKYEMSLKWKETELKELKCVALEVKNPNLKMADVKILFFITFFFHQAC